MYHESESKVETTAICRTALQSKVEESRYLWMTPGSQARQHRSIFTRTAAPHPHFNDNREWRQQEAQEIVAKIALCNCVGLYTLDKTLYASPKILRITPTLYQSGFGEFDS